jgi:NAD(P)-dependent dehydrogenase (short-subunit alcohol dehydrogenase family)
MATTKFSPPSIPWLLFKALKGANNATVAASEADMQGKWVLITGSNNGIGREAAIQFAKWGASIILACRQPPSHETHPEKVVEECTEAAAVMGAAAGSSAAQVFEWWECDMADLSSVEALAARWNETGRPLELLVNNAGIAGTPPPAILTRDGFELLHQINFLSHTLLTLSVLPSIARAASPRIICTTSCMHYLGQYDLANANSGVGSYAHNKLYFQMWLTELQVRLLRHPDYQHIAVHGIHPGYVKSGIWAATASDPLASILKFLLNWFGIDSAQGSVAITNAATGAQYGLRPAGEKGDELRGGARYINRVWEDEPNPYVWNAAYRKDVWDFVSKELVLDKRSGVSADLLKSI